MMVQNMSNYVIPVLVIVSLLPSQMESQQKKPGLKNRVEQGHGDKKLEPGR